MRLSTEKTKKVMVPEDPDSAFIIIRALSLEEMASINEKASDTNIGEGGTISMVIKPSTRANHTAKSCLKSWGNFFDEKGNELKFNAQNLNKVSNAAIYIDGKPVRFLEWVDKCHAEFLQEVEAEMGAAEKN